MSTNRCAWLGIALAALALLGMTGAAPAPAVPPKGPLGGELKVGGRYGFITGPGEESGYYGEVLAIDGGWVKVQTYRLRVQGRINPLDGAEKAGVLWLNLSRVTAVREKPPASAWAAHEPPG
jgi:hypothetical protein